MSKAKGDNPSKRKRGESTKKGSGKKVAAVKKPRGPKSHLEPSKGKVDADTVKSAREMLDDEEGSEDEAEAEGNNLAPRQSSSSSNKTAFLLNLDEKGISRTKAETQKLRRQELEIQQREERLARRERKTKKRKGKGKAEDEVEDEIDEDESGMSTDMEGASLPSDGEVPASDSGDESESWESSLSSDGETSHLKSISRRQKRLQAEEDQRAREKKKKRLPTRGEDGWSSGEDIEEESGSEAGKPVNRGTRVVHAPLPEENDDEEEDSKPRKMSKAISTITTGTRFGLQSPYDIMAVKKKSQRVMLAREQIARLSTDIINDPEVSLGFIKRLSVFAAAHVQSPVDKTQKAAVDDRIRASALLSLCAVFVDVLPGFRIRSLTEAEQSEKVNQELARRREWEQGLVKVYRDYLELCERITRSRVELSKVSLKAMCILVTKATQFNYRTNLLRSLVSYLSRRQWNAGSEEANEALIEVLKSDRHGEVSLEVVRLLNRMIKEKKFRVNERVLEMLRHLRLRDELHSDRRGDLTSVSRHTDTFNKSLKPRDIRKGKGQHLSKKGVKDMKEAREIERDLKEAEAEVDEEERERHQSETLKLLFVLYFSILKAPLIDNKLYIATLRGLSLFAHRINVDFFRDLLDVLRSKIRLCLVDLDGTDDDEEGDDEEEEEEGPGAVDEEEESRTTNLVTALHCIVAALELLSGQGEALNLDLSDMANYLFSILLPLSVLPELEQASSADRSSSPSSLLLRAIHLALVAPPIHTMPTERLAAFIIRLLICALQTPAKTTLGLLQATTVLMSKKEELKGLLDNSDRAKNGSFDSHSNLLDGLRPLQSGYIPWQLGILHQSCHEEIRQQCNKILSL